MSPERELVEDTSEPTSRQDVSEECVEEVAEEVPIPVGVGCGNVRSAGLTRGWSLCDGVARTGSVLYCFFRSSSRWLCLCLQFPLRRRGDGQHRIGLAVLSCCSVRRGETGALFALHQIDPRLLLLLLVHDRCGVLGCSLLRFVNCACWRGRLLHRRCRSGRRGGRCLNLLDANWHVSVLGSRLASLGIDSSRRLVRCGRQIRSLCL